MKKPTLNEVLEEADRKYKRQEAMKPVWALLVCIAAGFLLYVFGAGLDAIF